MKRFASLGLALFLTTPALFAGPGNGVSGIFWSTDEPWPNPSRIWRADLDGSNAHVIIDGLPVAWPVVVDVTTHKVYWGDVSGTNRQIQRANLDGTSVETVVSFPSTFIGTPSGIALDSANQRIYWTDFSYRQIARTELVGGGTMVLVNTSLNIPHGMDLDLAAGQMYWADANVAGILGTGQIRRAAIDGGASEAVHTNVNNPFDVKVDAEGGMIYWTEADGIWRSNLDGSGVEEIAGGPVYTRLEIDHLERKVLWYGWHLGILRADLDGTNQESLYTYPNDNNTYYVNGIAVLHDCNGNHVDDFDDIRVADCNQNRSPDDCDPDADSDLVPNDCDNCPHHANAPQGDCNGNGAGDACEPNVDNADDDSDGACNGVDGCAADPNKVEPGVCGCGFADTDADFDGVADCLDQCPGAPDADADGDGVLDCHDGCPGEIDVDSDGDGVLDCDDQCPGAPELDDDLDTVLNCVDQCLGENDLLDGNGNGVPDCMESTSIPTVSTWGIVVLALTLLIAAKTGYAARPV